ncbi:carbamate kinase [Thalassospira mesophila]|uniref:carbamate kinase n=1 Tax=Thalassospira mesophila TaxID=1293891 RepID=UPI000A1E7CF1|nr:carbamate kinase [Thalassospira mesophila]
MRLVIALGGNALLRRGQKMTVENQRENIRVAAAGIARLASDHEIILTHGNGPQVGLIALQNATYRAVDGYPLDVLDAESEGMIGYLLETELRNNLHKDRDVATLLTEVEVALDDPAFAHPTKPIGPQYSDDEASALQTRYGWSMVEDGGKKRRVVPSPRPKRILQQRSIVTLSASGTIVIAVGGGGIPVTLDENGKWHGVEAVIDKDRASAILARDVDADGLILLTDVNAVMLHYGTADQQPVRHAAPGTLNPADFPAGSMGPKIEAANSFAANQKGFAAIGALDDLEKIIRNEAGTLFRCDPDTPPPSP